MSKESKKRAERFYVLKGEATTGMPMLVRNVELDLACFGLHRVEAFLRPSAAMNANVARK
ncbi:uncharacterized protein N7473_009207 [Penicillium subrubescens]|jgi:hypothetical protein|uniref:Uncharacterized protein n=1 Tax=Penicillium subrubescens TaxID=1316194 RepID=A0A1Q5URK2_9EURO|nr:uncharacterized protein N7473_009207 [Penicillium subrubescens]KAJ5886533.1 hypothetical protein N7473_009207 [Penicillium subrubescens]OKP15103.1 hypothetical protein PENSUB_2251 [Penicillium subrubescens]